MTTAPGRRPQFDAQEEIKRIILNDGLEAGGAMPTEVELMTLLGISRGSVREALKGLQARGIIKVRHGRGMFVAHPSLDSLIDGLIFRGRLERDDLTTASELIDVRDILESALVQQVARQAEPLLIATLDATVRAMEKAAAEGMSFQDSDRLFHEQLYSGLGNNLVIQLVRAFWDVLDAVRPQLAAGRADGLADAAYHRRILNCIGDGDPEGARLAMVDHFRDTHLWIQGHRPGRHDTEPTNRGGDLP